MPLTVSNRQASPVGLWGVPTAYKIAPAMNGATVIVEPTLASQAIIDLLIKAGVATAVDNSPVNTVAPAITGTAQVGETLTLSNGTWAGSPSPSYTRRWQISDDGLDGWTNISGATATTYSPVEGDVGKFLRGVVTATNTSGVVSAVSAATDAVLAE